MMHPIYLPFSEERLAQHFADVKKSGTCVSTAEQHLAYYRKSLERYRDCPEDKEGKRSLKDTRKPCQVEKDEKFWTAACLMTVFQSSYRVAELTQLLREAYGHSPPADGLSSWKECFDGDLHLFFETNLPSPKLYKQWLRSNVRYRQFIPYILESTGKSKNLEGPTNVDAILVNSDNGFAIVMEAKVLSDISYDITYDVMRNQIARNIDVMLEPNDNLCLPLKKRKPENTLFLLISPSIFKKNPTSRLYGYKLEEYKANPSFLANELPHRREENWEAVSKRIGWLTWEDFKDVNPSCCRWLD